MILGDVIAAHKHDSVFIGKTIDDLSTIKLYAMRVRGLSSAQQSLVFAVCIDGDEPRERHELEIVRRGRLDRVYLAGQAIIGDPIASVHAPGLAIGG
jgi:hypothetical protein